MKNHQKPSCAGQQRIIQNDVDHFFFILFRCVSVCYLVVAKTLRSYRELNLSKHLCADVDVEFFNILGASQPNVFPNLPSGSPSAGHRDLASQYFELSLLADLVCRHSPENVFSLLNIQLDNVLFK